MTTDSLVTLMTSNAGKAAEFAAILGIPVARQVAPLVEIQALDVSDVAQSKARQAFDLLGTPVLVDDSAIIIDAWRGLPGALTSWFMDTVGNEGILQMAATLANRRARVVTAIGYADERGPQVFLGEVLGELSTEVRGENGFGYDPIFVPDGLGGRTFAELDQAEKNSVSMRRIALENFRSAVL
jgi:XTP/dITP diphosphohydrolase